MCDGLIDCEDGADEVTEVCHEFKDYCHEPERNLFICPNRTSGDYCIDAGGVRFNPT